MIACLLLSILGTVRCGIWSVGCGVVSSEGIYDLKGLGSMYFPLTPSTWAVNLTGSNQTLQFSLCRDMPCCSGAGVTKANLVGEDSCTPITSHGAGSYSLKERTCSRNALVELSDGSTGKGVTVDYSVLGHPCDFSGNYYNLTIHTVCNRAVPKQLAKAVLISEDKCSYEVMIEVEDACAKVDLSAARDFVESHSVLLAIGLGILGITVGVFGRPMWNSIVFLLFAATAAGVLLLVLYELVLPFDPPKWILWTTLLISVVMGAIAAYFIARYQAAGFVLLGVWFGASFTILFKNFVLRVIISAFLIYKMWKSARVKALVLSGGLLAIPLLYTLWPNEATFWASLAGTSALCGVSAYFLKDLLVTVATAFVGAYLAARSATVHVADFPNEYEIYKRIVSGNLEVTFSDS